MQGIKNFFIRKSKTVRESPLSVRDNPNLNAGDPGKLQGIIYKYDNKMICLRGNLASKDGVLTASLSKIEELESSLASAVSEKDQLCKEVEIMNTELSELSSELISTKQALKDSIQNMQDSEVKLKQLMQRLRKYSSSPDLMDRLDALIKLKENCEQEKNMISSLQSGIETEMLLMQEEVNKYKKSLDLLNSDNSKLKSQLSAKKYEVSVYLRRLREESSISTEVERLNNTSDFDSRSEMIQILENKLEKATTKCKILRQENGQLKTRLEKFSCKNEKLTKQLMDRRPRPKNTVDQLLGVKSKLESISRKSSTLSVKDVSPFPLDEDLFKIKIASEETYKTFHLEFSNHYNGQIYSIPPEAFSNIDQSINSILVLVQELRYKSKRRINRANTYKLS